jgi:hypothetical protein
VFRATILTIVCLFAVGPSASLLCASWCAPRAAAEDGCHHEQSAGDASVGSADSCEDSVFGPAELLKEDLRRAPASDARPGVCLPRFQTSATATSPVAAWPQGRLPAILGHPQAIPLRI